MKKNTPGHGNSSPGVRVSDSHFAAAISLLSARRATCVHPLQKLEKVTIG